MDDLTAYVRTEMPPQLLDVLAQNPWDTDVPEDGFLIHLLYVILRETHFKIFGGPLSF